MIKETTDDPEKIQKCIGCSLRTGLMNQGKEVLIRAVLDSPLLVVELNLVVASVVKLKFPTRKYS